ncbi:MAG: AAA family ATPase [Muribaculaceae bacterium]|nr:AAA family ATPase [Muribaculaceae bacterium]MDY5118888.1 AAA family ATPase [Muribaculaceae bacterium]
MEARKLKRCPIGIQTFSDIIEENYMYVDKTDLVYELAHGDSRYVFLSRPRRFGKSLLASTLHSYFTGRKELFKGLKIDKLETEWTQYPVLHFDMSSGKHMTVEALEEYLGSLLSPYEKLYGITPESKQCNIRLKNLIPAAYEQTGKKVVIIIDEYDAPLLDVVHEEENLPKLRDVMRNFYSPLKACDPYIRFAFLTGITKFSQLSIFSELNNIANVSMDEAYAAICGITKEELVEQFAGHIDALAEKMGKTHDEMVEELAYRYDGYHFTWPSPDIFNPFSLLNALGRQKLDNYWFGSGTPTYLIEMMRKFDVLPSEIEEDNIDTEDFDVPTEQLESITPLLYQSGYLTIKNYKPHSGLYSLGIPNNEVRIGLMNSLLPVYTTKRIKWKSLLSTMRDYITENDMDGALKWLQTFLDTVPYCDNANSEGHYQQMLYIIFSLMGFYLDVEVHTAKGRVDLVLHAPQALYIIEIKLNKSAEAAMTQIELKQYDKRFSLLNLPVVKVGVNFSTDARNITDWTITYPRK